MNRLFQGYGQGYEDYYVPVAARTTSQQEAAWARHANLLAELHKRREQARAEQEARILAEQTWAYTYE